MYNYFKDNFILSIFQSGFQSGKSTVTQLIEVYHYFCKAVDEGKEIRVIFLDISKAFDKVWHKGLLLKLQQCGISGSLFDWFNSYLIDRQQRVVINGQASSWGSVEAGVPQGSVLGPLLFLVYINDITHVVKHCNIRLFADDTCLFIEVDNRDDTTQKINSDLESICNWSKTWLITFSPPKTKSLTISNKDDSHLNKNVSFNNHIIDEVQSHTYLGLQFSNNLRWSHHIDDISKKARQRLNLMLPLKYKLDRYSLETMYTAFVLPTMEYGMVVWGGTYDIDFNKLEKIQIDALRLITGATARSNISLLYTESKMQTIAQRRDQAMLVMLYRIKNNLAPSYLTDLNPPINKDHIRYNLRNSLDITIPQVRLESFKRSFFPYTITLWNKLPENKRSLPSLDTFKNAISHKDKCNVLYYYGKRWPSVHHARIRLGCSKLNNDLHMNLHVINSSQCPCGYHTENASHFFFHCPNYIDIRIQLFNVISCFCAIDIKVILEGNDQLDSEKNETIFDAVHHFIIKSNRFQ